MESLLTPAFFRDLRDFWFENVDRDNLVVAFTGKQQERWFAKGRDIDEACRQRFGPALEIIRANANIGQDVLDAAQLDGPLDWVALLILLDQIPRNINRGRKAPIAYTLFDSLAQAITLVALERGIPNKLPEIRWQFGYRFWFYLPLMHSEYIVVIDRATHEFELVQQDLDLLLSDDVTAGGDDEYRTKAAKIAQQEKEVTQTYVDRYTSFSKRHVNVIRRFGRYPHRNAVMGRGMSQEEKEFLENGGDTFTMILPYY